MSRWTGPYREPARKSDYYMPPYRQDDAPPVSSEPGDEPEPQMSLSALEAIVQKYVRAGVRGQELVVAAANSSGYNLATVAQWIQREHPELKRKSKQALRGAKRRKKR